MQTVKAEDFHRQPTLLAKYELYLEDEWQVFEDVDVYRMPNSPILFYAGPPFRQVDVEKDVMIEVRPKQ